MQIAHHLFGWLALAVVADATIMEDYGPFLPGKEPPRFKLTSWVRLAQAKLHYEFAETGRSYPRLTLDWDGKTTTCQVQLKQRDGTAIISTHTDALSNGADVFTADLNGDKIPDFIIETYTAANGLGPDRCLTFLLSIPKGYVVQSLVGNDLVPDKVFFDPKQDGHPVMLLTRLVYGEKGKDGNVHNYWVSNLLSFDGGKIVLANTRDSRFPFWTLYTFKPNHTPESQLTPAQRASLWSQSVESTPLEDDAALAKAMTPPQAPPAPSLPAASAR